MVKLNRPKRGHNEGSPHFETKLMVMDIADTELSIRAKELELYVATANEFPFIPMWIHEDENEKDPRGFIGDVVCLLYRDYRTFKALTNRNNLFTWDEIQNMADFIINYEIDGIEGHSSKSERAKNSTRDYELAKKGIMVKRIQSENIMGRFNYKGLIKKAIIDFYNETMSPDAIMNRYVVSTR